MAVPGEWIALFLVTAGDGRALAVIWLSCRVLGPNVLIALRTE